MPFVQRKITYRLYPNRTHNALLVDRLGLYCRVHNTLLEEHRRRFETKEASFNFSAMCKELTLWRSRVPALADLNAQSLQVVAKRASLAFAAFFRRVKAGEAAGYPRFKSADRFSGWGYKTHGDGWKIVQPVGGQHGKIRLSGIGEIPMRGKGRFEGTPKTAEIIHKAGKWYASITYNVEPGAIARTTGTEAAAFDWGLSTLMTLVKSDGTRLKDIENPRWLKQKQDAIVALQRTVSKEEIKAKAQIGLPPDAAIPKGQRLPVSAKMKRLYAQSRALQSKAARQRHDFYHQLTAKLVARFAYLGSEELAVKNMVKRPKAKRDESGQAIPNGACRKAGLNRSIYDAAPSMLLGMLKTKAEEAGSEFVLANTRILKPTQRCHACGTIVSKTLADRTHRCACGTVCDRDENAARTILRWMIEGNSWFASGTGATGTKGLSETPAIAQRAWRE